MVKFRAQLKNRPRKRRETKRPKPPSFKMPLPVFLTLLVAAAVIIISFFLLYIKSPYFVVKNVTMTGRGRDSGVNYDELERMIVNQNIFKLDLRSIRGYMLDNYQELLDVRFKRAFPDSVIAEIILRRPVAQLYQRSYYPVDEDGVILSGVSENPDTGMPIINGVRINLSKDIGKKADSARIKKALLLLKELNKAGILDRHSLIEIDVSSLRNIIFFLEDGLEVKIGREDYASRLENLREVFSDPKLNPADIRYVDLRFKEPVIGPKWKR